MKPQQKCYAESSVWGGLTDREARLSVSLPKQSVLRCILWTGAAGSSPSIIPLGLGTGLTIFKGTDPIASVLPSTDSH